MMLESCIYTCRRGAYVVKGCKQEMLPFPLENGCNSWEEKGVHSKKIRKFKFSRLNRESSQLKIWTKIFRNKFSRLSRVFQSTETVHVCICVTGSVDWSSLFSRLKIVQKNFGIQLSRLNRGSSRLNPISCISYLLPMKCKLSQLSTGRSRTLGVYA